MIKEKLYTCIVKEDPEKQECLAIQFYTNRYNVLCQGIWRSCFKHELDKIEPARLVPGLPVTKI
jgi:hypothetical protein